QKRAIALESMDPAGAPSDVARRYGISSGLLYTWRRQMMEGQLGSAPQPVAGFARVDRKREPTPTFQHGPQLTRFVTLVDGVGADVGERGLIRGA
ncbi:MAG: transposase, partial [Janthinobacterium lividum]